MKLQITVIPTFCETFPRTKQEWRSSGVSSAKSDMVTTFTPSPLYHLLSLTGYAYHILPEMWSVWVINLMKTNQQNLLSTASIVKCLQTRYYLKSKYETCFTADFSNLHNSGIYKQGDQVSHSDNEVDGEYK